MATPEQTASFADRIDALLTSIEEAVDRLPGSVEVDTERSGNVLTLTFESGHRMVVNSQDATQELWLAARSGGFHYRFDAASGRWNDTRGGDDFHTTLGRLLEGETGVPVSF